VEESILEIFKRTGSLLHGHFVLSSGLHSREFFQCTLVLQHADLASEICACLAAKLANSGADSVISPALGGIIGEVVVVGSIVDRSGQDKPDFGCKFESLLQLQVETFAPDQLPPDLRDVPAIKPGSR
jgi:hypothetical protein